jgi:site-specific recombinase
MKHYRLQVEIDIVAEDREHAETLSRILSSLLRQRNWIREVVPGGIEERTTTGPQDGTR